MSILKKFSNSFLKQLSNWNKYEIIYGALVTIILLTISIITVSQDSPIWISVISIMAGFFGVWGTLLAAKRSVWNYFWGIIHIVLYGITSFYARLYGDFMLNIFFFLPTNIYAIWIWKSRENDMGQVNPRKLKLKHKIIISLSTVIFTVLYAFLLDFLGDAAPWLDSASTVLSVTGMFLMIYAFREQYFIWILVNIVSTIMWIISLSLGNTAAIPMVIMWSIYILSGFWGLYNWYRKPKYIGYKYIKGASNGTKAIYK
ncbi:MAG: nicotinamide mononucleotide transporter [Mycoplasmataceae bacterium]|nr:nicotinamide mononucleotide transporter [Mycoplasmataceae bacterium]